MQGLVNTMFFPALDDTKDWELFHSNLRANSERETNSEIHLC